MKKLGTLVSSILLGVTLLIFGVSYSEESKLFDPDGFTMRKSGTEFKMGYIAGFIRAKSDTPINCFLSVNLLIKKLETDKAMSESFDKSELSKMAGDIVKAYCIEHTYDNIPFWQLVSGVDKFYEDSANMKITVPDVLAIVKFKITGEKESYIQCMTEFHRMSASTTDPLSKKITKKADDCSTLRK